MAELVRQSLTRVPLGAGWSATLGCVEAGPPLGQLVGLWVVGDWLVLATAQADPEVGPAVGQLIANMAGLLTDYDVHEHLQDGRLPEEHLRARIRAGLFTIQENFGPRCQGATVLALRVAGEHALVLALSTADVHLADARRTDGPARQLLRTRAGDLEPHSPGLREPAAVRARLPLPAQLWLLAGQLLPGAGPVDLQFTNRDAAAAIGQLCAGQLETTRFQAVSVLIRDSNASQRGS